MQNVESEQSVETNQIVETNQNIEPEQSAETNQSVEQSSEVPAMVQENVVQPSTTSNGEKNSASEQKVSKSTVMQPATLFELSFLSTLNTKLTTEDIDRT